MSGSSQDVYQHTKEIIVATQDGFLKREGGEWRREAGQAPRRSSWRRFEPSKGFQLPAGCKLVLDDFKSFARLDSRRGLGLLAQLKSMLWVAVPFHGRQQDKKTKRDQPLTCDPAAPIPFLHWDSFSAWRPSFVFHLLQKSLSDS